MEALVVALAALVAAVLIDAGYWIAVSLMRWSPVIVVGAATAWFSVRAGVTPAEALLMSALVGIVARHLRLRVRDLNDC
ncbi:MAG: hypothetical protein KDA35_06055 [Hyphomonadaceae bacterium]|nr:hypothetical protein [Hyphomonadaceae bacterium]